MKVCVLIPSYNEERTIGGIVKEIKKMGLDVIVVNDGSTDNTEKVAAENGAVVIRHIKNLGKGASLKEGFKFILRMGNVDAVIVMDADGQHNPKEIQNFIEQAEKFDHDIIIGNRMALVNKMPLIRFVTNKFMSFFLSRICKQHIADTQCGFRLIRKKVLQAIKLETNRYDLESELLIKASRRKYKITSMPIETVYRGQLSNIRPIKDTIRFIVLVVKSYLK